MTCGGRKSTGETNNIISGYSPCRAVPVFSANEDRMPAEYLNWHSYCSSKQFLFVLLVGPLGQWSTSVPHSKKVLSYDSGPNETGIWFYELGSLYISLWTCMCLLLHIS